jgi:hypothetical protein
MLTSSTTKLNEPFPSKIKEPLDVVHRQETPYLTFVPSSAINPTKQQDFDLKERHEEIVA